MKETAARRYWPLVLLFGLLMGLAFQGSRGIWDSDEGRYSNIALQMLDGGDWLIPHRHPDTTHLTKPPATYWALAGSVAVFGVNEWALRLPNALAFALSVLLCFGIGRRLFPARPWLPALVYACSPIPFFAANWISTDTLLAAAETLAMWCYVEARFAGRERMQQHRWIIAMWAAFGLAFMIKGPPALLPLLALVAWRIGDRRNPASPRLFPPLGVLAFLMIGLGWYVYAVLRVPGLIDYFLGHELAARIVSDKLRRFPQWWGALYVYLPTLLFGALPWLFWSGLRRGGWLCRRPRFSGWLERWRGLPDHTRFLWLWLLLPLLVFVLARSRLPLYLLPLFVPISMLLALSLQDRQWTRSARSAIAVWILLLLALKLALSFYPSRKDGRQLADEILPEIGSWPAELVFVDDYTRYALAVYCQCRIEKISLDPILQPKPVSEADFDDDFAREMDQQEGPRVFVLLPSRVPHLEQIASQHGHEVIKVGAYRNRVLYRIDSDPR